MLQSNSIRFLILALAVCSSCAQKSYINSVQVTSHVSNGDEFASLKANIDTQQLALPALSLPIIDLQNPALSYGDLTIAPNLDGKTSDLTIDVDLTVALKLPTSGQSILLPNRTSLPIGGINLAQTMEFSLGGTSSKVYLELDAINKKAFIGTALVIPQLNFGVNANLFIPFSSNNIAGTAGIFAGAQAGQSGLGIFADLSPVLANKTMLLQRVANLASPVQPHQFLSLKPSAIKQMRIQNMLMNLNSHRTRLEVR